MFNGPSQPFLHPNTGKEETSLFCQKIISHLGAQMYKLRGMKYSLRLILRPT